MTYLNALDPSQYTISEMIERGEREWHESFNAMTEEERQWFLADIELSDPERTGSHGDDTIEIDF